MLDSVNAARKKAGVAPLELDKKVGKAAQLRANECKQSYDHTRPNGKKSKTDEALFVSDQIPVIPTIF